MSTRRDTYSGQLVIDGAAHVRTYGPPGFLETKEFLLLAADTNEIAAGGTIVIPPTKLFTGSGFTTGLQRARLSIQINGAAADDFWGVRATLNALDNANACDRLSVDASLVAVNNVTTKAARMISPLSITGR